MVDVQFDFFHSLVRSGQGDASGDLGAVLEGRCQLNLLVASQHGCPGVEVCPSVEVHVMRGRNLHAWVFKAGIRDVVGTGVLLVAQGCLGHGCPW